MTYIQSWANVEDVGPTLYQCYTNMCAALLPAQSAAGLGYASCHGSRPTGAHACSMPVVLMDLEQGRGGGSPVYWATMRADTFMKKTELECLARWLVYALSM